MVNLAQLWGERAFVTASGTFSRVDPTDNTLPTRFVANIERGSVVVGQRTINLPIAGQGEFDVMYLDRQLRIFRGANGSLAVQVPVASLAAR